MLTFPGDAPSVLHRSNSSANRSWLARIIQMSDESSLKLDEDIRLMVKAREGNRSAYEKVYCRYFCTVVSFLKRRVGRHQACEDMAQEVFTRVWCNRNRYQPSAPVKNYLLGVASNVLREDRALPHPHVPPDAPDLDTLQDTSQLSPLLLAQSAERLQAVRTIMTNLPARQRQAIELVYLAGLPPGEAARRLGCSQQALYSCLCSARVKLRALARLSK